MKEPTKNTVSSFWRFLRRARPTYAHVVRQPKIPLNAAAASLLSNDAAEVSGLILASLDDPQASPARRLALAEEFLKQGQGERVPPAALVEWYVASQRVLRTLEGDGRAPSIDEEFIEGFRWGVAHFAARAGLAADCRVALSVALGGSVGTVPVPTSRLNELPRWQASHPAVLQLLIEALQPNQEPDAEQKRSFLRDQLTRQARRTSVSRPGVGGFNA